MVVCLRADPEISWRLVRGAGLLLGDGVTGLGGRDRRQRPLETLSAAGEAVIENESILSIVRLSPTCKVHIIFRKNKGNF